MGIRLRKFIGTVVLAVFLTVYCLVVMALGAVRVTNASVPVQTAFYLVAGLAWVIPAGLLVRWMQRP